MNEYESKSFLGNCKYFSVSLLIFVNIFNLALQFYFLSADFSPFELFDLEEQAVSFKIVQVYIGTSLFLLLGFSLYGFVLGEKVSCSSFLLNRSMLFKFVKSTSVLLAILLIVTQISLGDANIINLWRGFVNADDVERAITASFFGVHGSLLILIFFSLILWVASFELGIRNSPWIVCMLTLSLVSAVSQGKAQLLFYFLTTYSLQLNKSPRLIIKFLLMASAVLAFFFISRLLRNQELSLTASVHNFLLYTVGVYFGAPFVNTSYILDHSDIMVSAWEFFGHLLPARFFAHTDIYLNLPDISSPNGFIGNGLLLGGQSALYLYSLFIGWGIHFLFSKSRATLTFRLFYPFVVSACLLSFLYDHFVNLMFFWLPMLLSFILAKAISVKS